MTKISSRAMQWHAGLYVHAQVHGKQSECAKLDALRVFNEYSTGPDRCESSLVSSCKQFCAR